MLVDTSKINSNATVAVAVSGGSDSMALLHYLDKASKEKNFSVIALNVEHGIRGKESESDSAFVSEYCKKHNIPLLFYKIDTIKRAKEKKLSVEEAARQLRYECFNDAIDGGKCDYVATAHHMRDNAESVLFNMFRGTGIKGLSGIRDSGKIIRPLIKATKEEIDEYVTKNAIPYVIDSTNLSVNYTRNFIRIKLLPVIKQAFPEAEKSIARLSDIALEQSNYVAEQAKLTVTETARGAEIRLPQHNAILRIAVIYALKACGIEKDWAKIHVDDVISLTAKQTGKLITLPKGVTAKRVYDKIIFSTASDSDEKEKNSAIPFDKGVFVFGQNTLKITETAIPVDFKSGLYIDGDKIPSRSVIRYAKEGDVFTKFGGGSKKLRDYLIDKKIPSDERKQLPVIANDNEVYAIFGIAVSDKVKATAATSRLLKITKE